MKTELTTASSKKFTLKTQGSYIEIEHVTEDGQFILLSVPAKELLQAVKAHYALAKD